MKGQKNGWGRRTFLKGTALGAIGGGFAETFGSKLRHVSAAEATLPAGSVRFDDDIEPLVRLIEETPREKLIEEIATRVAKGRISYRELLAALLLAGVRNVEPRPAVGFKFHAVLVVNSAHLASLASPDADRWLPIFWALDHFKGSQARDVEEGNWTLAAVDEAAVPKPHEAIARFREAMTGWDEGGADVATAALARGESSGRVFDTFAEYAARDFRSIGHKVIYLANAHRTLETIGWQYAEPVLRSLSYAMLNRVGEPNPATSDLAPDRDGRINQKRSAEIRADWLTGKDDSGATAELLQAFREATSDDASKLVAAQLNAGVSIRSVYDAIFAAAAELTMRQPAIVPLHAMTTTNAIHYTMRTCSDDATRKFLVLQNASFIPQFREAAKGRGKLEARRIDAIEPTETTGSETQLTDIFRQLGQDPASAAGRLLGYLNAGHSAEDAMRYARQLIFLKGNDSHDYKYSSAVLEDYHQLTPAWRDRYLAASLFKMRSESEPTTPLVGRIREALKA
jgi:hypothetical protein